MRGTKLCRVLSPFFFHEVLLRILPWFSIWGEMVRIYRPASVLILSARSTSTLHKKCTVKYFAVSNFLFCFCPLMTSDDLQIPFSHFQLDIPMISFHLICNMPMFLEEERISHHMSFEVIWKSLVIVVVFLSPPPEKNGKNSLIAIV